MTYYDEHIFKLLDWQKRNKGFWEITRFPNRWEVTLFPDKPEELTAGDSWVSAEGQRLGTAVKRVFAELKKREKRSGQK